MADPIYNVLFLCTGNSARSIMAESILRKDGAGHFKAFSAGINPKPDLDPVALKVLDRLGYPTEGLKSKPWTVFTASDAPEMDFIFTLSDEVAGEAEPGWPGQPVTAHWGIEKLAGTDGNPMQVEAFYSRVARFLKNRISAFLNLPLSTIDRMSLQSHIDEIGQIRGEGA